MRRYFAEFNRVIGDNIRIAARSPNRMGLNASRLPHKTSLVIERPRSMSWSQFTAAILAVLQPRRGSVMMSSEHSGKAFLPSILRWQALFA
jgi:hypothetical protein